VCFYIEFDGRISASDAFLPNTCALGWHPITYKPSKEDEMRITVTPATQDPK
jgi:hypothetical protein